MASKDRSKKNNKNIPIRDRDFSKLKKITARSDNQLEYMKAVEENKIILASGPAGCGKTFLAVYEALTHVWSKEIKKIVITRPAVEAGGERIGFLPGDLEEKLNPYLRPIFDSLHSIASVDIINQKLEKGHIEIAPLGFLRGRTFSDCFVIVDEAQNATFDQLIMAVTRVGENCKMVINGDPDQSDLKNQTSGIEKLQEILEEVEGVAVIKFDTTDVVRSKIVTDILNVLGKHAGKE